VVLGVYTVPCAGGYAFDEVVPDVRQAVALSGGSACPVRAHQLSAAGTIAVRWSTALGTSPVTILTQNQTANGQLAEIEQTIRQSLAVWIGVSDCLIGRHGGHCAQLVFSKLTLRTLPENRLTPETR
jgi:hypothetical protein